MSSIISSTRPSPGHLLRDYQLTDASGQQMMLSDYRGRLNLVVITSQGTASGELLRLLRDLDSQPGRLREWETQVLLISPTPINVDFPNIRVLVDETAQALTELGVPAVYVTDRFREVVQQFDALPSASDIFGWVEFTAMQCPECHPPEWPVP